MLIQPHDQQKVEAMNILVNIPQQILLENKFFIKMHSCFLHALYTGNIKLLSQGEIFFAQLMSNNSRIQQLKMVTIWWWLHGMHGSENFLAESIRDTSQNPPKATLWSEMTDYVENHKRRGKKRVHSKYGKHLSQLCKDMSWLLESVSTMMRLCCVLCGATTISSLRTNGPSHSLQETSATHW